MNAILRIPRTPWIASSRSARWSAAFAVVFGGGFAIWTAIVLRGHERLALCGVLWCLALVAWWLLVVPNALWMGRDATALRLPGVRRAANRSVLMNTAFTVVLPALALGLTLGHGPAWLELFSLIATGCMLFLLLPSWLMCGACLMLGAVANLHLLHVKPPGIAQLADWALLPSILLVALAAWRWFRLLDMQVPATIGWGRPVIWNLRYRIAQGTLGGRSGDAILARSARGWLAPTLDLHAVGAAHPARSMRVALGRNAMPQTLPSHLRQWGFGLAAIALFTLPSVLPVVGGGGDVRKIYAFLLLPGSDWFFLPVLVGCIAVIVIIVTMVLTIPIRWSGTAAELSLLSLLPGLGSPAEAKRHATRACLAGTLAGLSGTFVILCTLGAADHILPAMALYALPCIAGAAGFAIAIILGTLGGKPLSAGTTSGWLIILFILTAVTLSLAVSHAGQNVHFRELFLGLWLITLITLALLCLRGWRALQRRPHPFLANMP